MKWQGVFPAITTPFREDLSLDLDFLPRHLEAMLAAGCTGFVPLGSLGESATLTLAEKGAVLDACREGARRPRRARRRDRRPLDGGGGRDGAPGRRKGLRRAHGPAAVRLPAGPARDGGALLGRHRRDAAAVHALQQPDRVRHRRLGRRARRARRPRTRTSPRSRSRAATCAASPRSAPLLGDRLAIFVGVDDLIVEGVAAGAVGWIAGLVNALPAESVRLFDLAVGGQARRGARPLRVVPAAAAPGRRARSSCSSSSSCSRSAGWDRNGCVRRGSSWKEPSATRRSP